jgi:hypothetical protein
LVVLTGTALGGDVLTVSGKKIAGEVAAVSDKQVTIQTGAGKVTVPTRDVGSIQLREPTGQAGSYAEVELADGSVIHCSQYALKKDTAVLTLVGSNRKLTVPLASISYLLNDAQEPAARQEWRDKFVSKKRSQDLLAVKSNSVMNGISGTLGQVNDQGEISFEYESGGSKKQRNVSPSRVLGLLFVRAPAADTVPTLCRLNDVDGNQFMVGTFQVGAESFRVKTVGGVALDFPKQTVARLDFNNDKLVYLSDLSPSELVTRSRSGWPEVLGIDKNLDRGPLQLKGDKKERGLTIHAYTELAYALDGKYAKLEATLGVDDSASAEAEALVRIEADGQEIFSGTVSRQGKTIDIQRNLSGVKQLRIVVATTRLLGLGAQAEIANAKLSK